jgi:hypothetical protein
MPKIKYQDQRFNAGSLEIIDAANEIIIEYMDRGFDLTLRQLYYQFVARDLIANKQSEYKRLGSIINDARLAGLIDWDAIVDRTRNLRGLTHWENPRQIVGACIHNYRVDKWEDQPFRPEVWIEKDALVGVISGVCNKNDVDFFSCRGYTSQSELWSAGVRFARRFKYGQTPVIIHLGDHDPSGLDMTRDILFRAEMFAGESVEVKRIALNMDQVKKYNPPPNPAKITDSRAAEYIARFGRESWELDALNPELLSDLVNKTIAEYRDNNLWDQAVRQESEGREQLQEIVNNL